VNDAVMAKESTREFLAIWARVEHAGHGSSASAGVGPMREHFDPRVLSLQALDFVPRARGSAADHPRMGRRMGRADIEPARPWASVRSPAPP
jgi:hypothetical protein